MPRKKTIVVFGLLFLSLLLSGCINTGGWSIWGSVQPTPIKQTSDLLVIDDIKVVPEKVYADTEFTVYFTVKHVGDPRTSEAVNYELKAYDFGVCSKVSQSWNENELLSIQPGEVQQYSITLKAPKNSEIANLEAHCPIRLKVSYTYTAKTQVEAYVMSEERMRMLQRTGRFQNYVPTQKVGIGPVKIYFEFVQEQPFIAGKNVVLFIYAKNEGDGDVTDEQLHTDVIEKPSGKIICLQPLQFIGDETSKVKCTWRPQINGDEKLFYLIAKAVDYHYSFEKTEDVTIYPLPE